MSLEEPLRIIENIENINIDGKLFRIKYFLGGDFKMLRILYGQRAANAREGCLWCNANLIDRPDINANWPIHRTISGPKEHLDPIIDFIDYKNCVVDVLHMLLRITDQLYELLLIKLFRMDNHDESNNIENKPYLKTFTDFLQNQCKLTNPFYFSENRAMFRNFNGNERTKIFEELFKEYLHPNLDRDGRFIENVYRRKNFNDLYPNNISPNEHIFNQENYVWSRFYILFNKIKNFDSDRDSLEILSDDLRKWLKVYLALNYKYRLSVKITSYIHIFTFHTVEMIRTHGNINLFNTQGLEKLNGFTIGYYQRCSNKHVKEKKYLLQLIRKRSRVEFYTLNGEVEDFFMSEESDEDEQDEN